MSESLKDRFAQWATRAGQISLNLGESLWLELNWLRLRFLKLLNDRRITKSASPEAKVSVDPAVLQQRRGALAAGAAALDLRRAASLAKLGFGTHSVGAIALAIVCVATAVHLHSSHKPSSVSQEVAQANGSPASSSVGTELQTVADVAPTGPTVEPTFANGQRFSDQMIALLKADVMAGHAIDPSIDRLSQSSETRIRRILELEKEVASETALKAQMDRDLPELGKDILVKATAFMLANTTTTSEMKWDTEKPDSNQFPNPIHSQGRWGYEVTTTTWAPGAKKQYDAMFAPLQKGKADSYQAPYRRKQAMRELEPLLRDEAVAKIPPTNRASDLSVKIGDTLDVVGNAVVSNASGITLHHCMIIVHGEEAPEKQFGVALIGQLDQQMKHDARQSPEDLAIAETEDKTSRMPEISVAYRDTLAPGVPILLPVCTSRGVRGLTALRASVWADETGVEGVQASNFDRAGAIADDLHDKQIAADEQKEKQAAIDQRTAEIKSIEEGMVAQRKSINVVSGDGSITYQFLVYPQSVPEGIVAPADLKHVDIVGQSPDDPMTVFSDNTYYHPETCKPNSVLHISAGDGSGPRQVTVRFLTRDYRAGEQPFTAPGSIGNGASMLTADQQRNHKAILAALAGKDVIIGHATDADKSALIFKLHLTTDPASNAIGGWIQYNQPVIKLAVDARIIDDPTRGTLLQVIELSLLEGDRGAIRTRPIGRVYEFKLGDEGGSPAFAGTWTFRRDTGFKYEGIDQGTAEFAIH